MSEWIYPVRIETKKTLEFRINEVRFGEGYAQRAPKRLEETLRRWPVVCDLPWADSVQADYFLRSHAGCYPFWFTEPHTGEQVLVVCKDDVEFTPTGGGTRVRIATVFEEYA